MPPPGSGYMPQGSTPYVSVRLDHNGIPYVDWNVSRVMLCTVNTMNSPCSVVATRLLSGVVYNLRTLVVMHTGST